MPQKSRSRKLKVCLMSPHPLVRSEFERLLPDGDFQVSFRPLSVAASGELKTPSVPRAAVYVVDAQASPPIVHGLIENILERYPKGRVLVLGAKHTDSDIFEFLRLGVKGLLAYGQAENQWTTALPHVAAGGYWVPRAVLARFVESILGNRKASGANAKTPRSLSRREREVLESLLQNLSNKEIANKLNISERTVKFHVSNLLAKHGVRRRADLIVMRFQEAQLPI
jgi:DNA-binding NarL/FixJ family response regulator